jgi:formylglycine-generating enzyme required for sulfatase activity
MEMTSSIRDMKWRLMVMRYTSVFMLCVSLFVYAYGNNVSFAQGEIDKSKRWALIIGIGQYESKDDINPLRFAVNDATAIKEALVDPQTGTFLESHVLLLTDSVSQRPTRANILDRLAVLEKQIKPEDTLLIFFSGHGYPKGREIYLLPQDARLTVLQDTAIPLTMWNERIAQIPAQKKVIILDACHSGGVEKGKGGAGFMSSQFEQLIAPTVGQATLSSSKREQTSYEDEESGHGVFTRYLLDTLKGEGDANGDKVITLKEASEHVEERVRAWGVQKGKVQTPYLESSLTEDVILAFAKPTESIPQTFGIRIDTNPQGAKIFLNGQDTKKKTPQIITVPQVGEYQIELTLNGYKPYRGSVTISNNQPVAYITQSLQGLDGTIPEPTTQSTGILYVKALIDNREVVADVYIDGQKVGKTIYQNADMPSRTYEIEVRGSELYHPYRETIVVSENETTRVEAKLLPAFGGLKVTSEPSGASVDVLDMSDTLRKSGQTPLNIPQIKSGTYKLRLEKDRYYYPETLTITIEDGKTTEESVTFRPKFGTLVITSEPPDADVIFDGTSKGKTPLTLEKVLSGNYTLELRKELYLDWTGTVQIRDGQTTTMPITLPPNYGTLKVDYEPKGATVYLNDREIGKTPLTVNLTPDTYTLRITAGAKYRDASFQSIVIANGQTQQMGGELQRLKGGVKILSNPPEAEVYLNGEKVGVTPKALVDLDADDYTLTLKKEGYGDYTQTIRIREGMLPNIDVTLPQKGSVKVISTPTGADIYLDGAKVGITPKTLSELEPGNYTLTIKKKGYEDYTQQLSVKRGMLPNIDVTLEKITVPEGMALIPAGEFEMGSSDGESDERPVHTVYLDAFYMDKYEVTNAQYARFLNDYGRNADAAGHELLNIDSEYCLIEKVGSTYRPQSGYENHPVIEVSWYGAAAYAQFYGKRLPTEAEWEKAARGGLVGKKYPWGDEAPEGKASFGGDWRVGRRKRTLKPVGSFAPNGYGLYNMAGNVLEWCADEYEKGYYSKSPKNNPKGPGVAVTFKNNDFTIVTSERALRGGGWDFNTSYLRCAYRHLRSGEYVRLRWFSLFAGSVIL